jgi:hypothetical protein
VLTVLLIATLSCKESAAIIQNIKYNRILLDDLKEELIQTVKESSPTFCPAVDS